MYENIPHLLTPVVVDPKQASNALRWAVHEMEERYKTLAALGVRNIEQYNRNLRHMAEEAGEKGEGEAGSAASVHRRRHRRARRPDDGRRQRGRGIDLPARTNGPGRRHSPDPRDPAAVGGRHHRPHQGEPAGAHCLPRVVAHRFAHGPRRQRRRAAAREGRHAVPAAGLVALRAAPRSLHLGTRERAAGELPAQAGQAGVRRDDHRRGEAGCGARVREGRSLRRGLSHRGAERPGVNFLPAAPPANRLQPRGAPGGHDGGRRARFGSRRRQGSRGARRARTTSTRWTRRCGSGRCWSCAES